METIFMNSENSKTNESNKFSYEFTDKLNLKKPNKNIALANLSIYYTSKIIKSTYNNNKLKISAPSWNDEFDLSDRSYAISDIQDYFEYVIKKHETIADISPGQIYVNKTKNRIVFKIKIGFKLELLSPETKKLLESVKKIFDQETTGKYVPKLESAQAVLVHCNLVNNNYQQAPRALFTFMPDKRSGQLITVAPHPLIMLKTNNAEPQSIEVLFTDQNNRPLEIEDNVNITLMIGTGEYK